MDNIYYINLDHRKDRKSQVESELNDMGWKYQRFNAIKMKDGRVGCSMSHLKLLQMAKEKQLEYIVIIEDDIQFLRKNWYKKQLEKVMKEHYDSFDVLLLAGNLRPPIKKVINNTGYEHLYQITKSFTTTGYIVKKHYYDTLIENIKSGIQLLMKNPNKHAYYAVDTYWMELQKKDKWFIIMPRTITQRPNYSDIEKRLINYNHLMVDKF
jgi:glycosyl transferase family 25